MWARGQSLGGAARGQGQRNYPHTPAYIGHAQLTLTLFSRIIMWFPACVLLVFSSPAPAATLSLYLQAAAAAEIGYNLTQKNGHFIWAIKSNTHVAGPQTQIESLGELRRR